MVLMSADRVGANLSNGAKISAVPSVPQVGRKLEIYWENILISKYQVPKYLAGSE